MGSDFGLGGVGDTEEITTASDFIFPAKFSGFDFGNSALVLDGVSDVTDVGVEGVSVDVRVTIGATVGVVTGVEMIVVSDFSSIFSVSKMSVIDAEILCRFRKQLSRQLHRQTILCLIIFRFFDGLYCSSQPVSFVTNLSLKVCQMS